MFFMRFVQVNLPYSTNLYFDFLFPHNIINIGYNFKPGMVILIYVTDLSSNKVFVIQTYIFLKVRMDVSHWYV